MIWWLLAFALFVWWVGVRIGAAIDGLEGHFIDKQGAPRAGSGYGVKPHFKGGATRARRVVAR